MPRVVFDHEKKEWIPCETKTPYSIPLHHKLKEKLDRIKQIQEENWDCAFCITGIEGSGKSTLGKICMVYLSNDKATPENIASDGEDAFRKLEKLPAKSPLLIDEGSLMFLAKEGAKKEQIALTKVLNVIRQKRMTLIVVCPDWFDLSKYISVHRTRFLLRTKTDKQLRRGLFQYWGQEKKKLLYEIGKKKYNSYSAVKREWAGNFSDFEWRYEKEYQEIKRKSLAASFEKKKEVNKEAYWAVVHEKIETMLKNNQKEKKPLSMSALARLLGVSKDLFLDKEKKLGLKYPSVLGNDVLDVDLEPLHEYKASNEQKIFSPDLQTDILLPDSDENDLETDEDSSENDESD